MKNKSCVLRPASCALCYASCVLLCCLTIARIANAEIVDRVVAVVNGEAITQSDLDQMMASRLPEMLRATDRQAAFHSARRQAVEQLVDERLLAQAMKRTKMEVAPDEMDRAFEGFLQQRKMTRPQLEAALHQQGIPMEVFTQRIEEEVRQMKFVQQEVGRRVKISEQEMEEYYRTHMGKFKTSGRVRIAEILLAFAPGTDTTAREALRRRATGIVREIRQGGDFATLAKAHSKGPRAQEGGDLGIVDPTTLHPRVAQTMARLQVGEVSEPIPSKVGYHIIKLIDRGSTTGADYERLKDQIQQALYQEKMRGAIHQYVRQLRQRAYIVIKE